MVDLGGDERQPRLGIPTFSEFPLNGPKEPGIVDGNRRLCGNARYDAFGAR